MQILVNFAVFANVHVNQTVWKCSFVHDVCAVLQRPARPCHDMLSGGWTVAAGLTCLKLHQVSNPGNSMAANALKSGVELYLRILSWNG